MVSKLAKRYLFDITTIIQWSGPSVGIVRVERELAKRARKYLHEEVIFCVYSKRFQSFFRVKDEFVQAICLGLQAISPGQLNPAAPDSQAATVKEILAELPLLMDAEIRSSNKNCSQVQEILRLRARAHDREWRPHRETLYHHLLDGEIRDLNPSDTIISVGLDWEYKDLLHIGREKERLGFHYCALIHDLIPLELPHFVVPSYTFLLKGYFGELFWMVDKCIANSRTTMEAVSSHLERWRLPQPKLKMFHLGCDLPAAKRTAELPAELEGKKFALYVSTIEPRKNHRIIYEAYQHAVEAGTLNAQECCVVFVGHTGWNVNNLLDEIRANPITRDRFFMYEAVSDEFLHALYKYARMVVFPSYYEGFGLSLVEALALGKACIASDTPALVEVSEGRASHVRARDTISWAAALSEYFNNDGAVESAEMRAASGRIHSWEAAANDFFQLVMED